MKQLRIIHPCPVCEDADAPKFDPQTSDWCVYCTDTELKRQVRFSEARVNPESP